MTSDHEVVRECRGGLVFMTSVVLGVVAVLVGACGRTAPLTKTPVEELPNLLPTYPGLTLEETGGNIMSTYPIAGTQYDLLTHAKGKVDADAQTVLDFYKKELETGGWEIGLSTDETLSKDLNQGLPGVHLSRQKGGVGVNVTLLGTADSQTTEVIISYGPTQDVAPQQGGL